jgi:hypothetical protein
MPYAPLGDLRMYHEIHGPSAPLILLHGALARHLEIHHADGQ